MKDIALATGYSVNTISHALKDKPDISTKTKEYILKTAKNMGFIIDSVASSLKSGNTKTISVIVGDISNPHFGIIIREIEIVAFRNGYNTLIINSDENEELEKEAIISSASKRVDGIIICPTQKNRENIELLNKLNIPFLLLGRKYEDCNYAIRDDIKGGFLAGDYLFRLGYKRPMFFNGPIYISSARDRLLGIKKAYAEHNLPFDDSLVRTIKIKSGELSFDNLHIDKNDFDSIIVFSDMLAFELMSIKKKTNELENIPIVGFDNILKNMSLPISIATISEVQPMAEEAFSILMRLMSEKSENDMPIKFVSDVELVIYD